MVDFYLLKTGKQLNPQFWSFLIHKLTVLLITMLSVGAAAVYCAQWRNIQVY